MKDYLAYRPVQLLIDAQMLRSIRNQVREHMTNNQKFINDKDQVTWFYSEGRDENVKAYLIYNIYHACVGYGVLSRRIIGTDSSERWWGSIAVLPEFQRQGYGTAIYKMLRKLGAAWTSEIYLEIFSDNIGSLRAASKAGYQFINANDKTITMKGQTAYDTTF